MNPECEVQDRVVPDLSSVLSPTPQLKEPINLQRLVNQGEFSFERDVESNSEDFMADLGMEFAQADFDTLFESPFVHSNSILVTHFGRKKPYESDVTPQSIEAVFRRDDDSDPIACGELKQDVVLAKQVLKAGNGGKVSLNLRDAILFHYIMFVEGSDETFDSSVHRDSPEVFEYSKANVLPGIFLAIPDMEIGEVSKFILKPTLAFGKLGLPERDVPPDANILCYLEIVGVADEKLMKKTPLTMTAAERARLPFQDIIACIDQLQAEGLEETKLDHHEKALKKFRKALLILYEYPVVSETDELPRVLCEIYSNLAECYLNLGQPENACFSCKRGIKVAGDSLSLLRLYAKGELARGNCEEARKYCDRGLQLDKSNQEMIALKEEITMEEQKQKKAFDSMFKNMFVK